MSANDARVSAVNRRDVLKLVSAASTAVVPLGTAAAGDQRAPAPQPSPRYTFFNFE